MAQKEHDHELPNDMLKIARFAFQGVPDLDSVADIVTIKDVQIGLVFDICPQIQQLLYRDERDCTPTDNDKITAHLEELSEEEYINSLGRYLEYHFQVWEPPLKVVGGPWRQGYSYRRRNGLKQHCRLLFVIPTDETKKLYGAVVARTAAFRRDQALQGVPLELLEVHPKGYLGD